MTHGLQLRAKAAIDQLQLPRVLFDYRIAWSSSYRALLAGEAESTLGIDSMLERASKTGRALIVGRAGSGKSVILKRLAKHAIKDQSLVILIDLRNWSPIDAEKVATASQEAGACMNYLLSRFGSVKASLLDLDVFSPSVPKYVLVDGINEVPSKIGSVILEALDDLVTRLIGVRVIVADRLTRRSLREDRWNLGRVEPLDNDSINKALRASDLDRHGTIGVESRLLDWPFFLAKTIEERRSDSSGVEALRQFFVDSVGLADVEMASVGAASLLAYSENKSRTFLLETFQDRVGAPTFAKLTEAGALESSGRSAYFRHHLHHDFMAASYVAAHSRLWTFETFDNLTFQASSFDAIALAFARVLPQDKGAFVRCVYDWNPYAIAFALAEDEYRRLNDLETETELVVLAMLAEKRWDPVVASNERATDALSLFSRQKNGPYLQAESLADLLTFVMGLESDLQWFNDWQRIFCLRANEQVRDDTVRLLADEDSIVGWTLANVLKRIRLEPAQHDDILNFAAHARVVVRWRAVHVLGALPTDASVTVCFERLDRDTDFWVRYGAVRSVIEIAARGDDGLRQAIIQGVKERVGVIRSNVQLRDELRRALRIRFEVASPGWPQSAVRITSLFLDASESVAELDYWSRALSQLRTDYGQLRG